MTIREFDPNARRLWIFLSALVGIGKVFTMVGAGVLIASFVIPANQLSQSTIDYYYKDTYEFTRHYLTANSDVFDSIAADVFAKKAATDRVEQLRFEDRNRGKDYAQWFLWPSIAMWGLFFLIRRSPSKFDNSLVSLPAIVSDRVPYFLIRWRWMTFDESGNVINEGLSRTVRAAKRAIVSSQLHSRATIEQNNPFREEYYEFIATLRKLKRRPLD